MAHGSPYYDETTILGEALVEPRNVSGYYTMTMATTFMFNTSRLLCSYTESVLRVGSLVYVKASAPVCCCPAAYNDDSRVGAFQCPVGFSSTSLLFSCCMVLIFYSHFLCRFKRCLGHSA